MIEKIRIQKQIKLEKSAFEPKQLTDELSNVERVFLQLFMPGIVELFLQGKLQRYVNEAGEFFLVFDDSTISEHEFDDLLKEKNLQKMGLTLMQILKDLPLRAEELPSDKLLRENREKSQHKSKVQFGR